MAYSLILAERIRRRLAGTVSVEEKPMMGGLTFMVNNKMCVGIIGDEMMCRISPDVHDEALLKPGCRIMDFTGRPMRGYVMVNDAGMKKEAQFDYWIGLCLANNDKAKASKKRK